MSDTQAQRWVSEGKSGDRSHSPVRRQADCCLTKRMVTVNEWSETIAAGVKKYVISVIVITCNYITITASKICDNREITARQN